MGSKMGPGGNGFTGDSFRFRADDGTELDTGGGEATWLAAINTDISLSPSIKSFRIRMGFNYLSTVTSQKRFGLATSFNGGTYFQIRDFPADPAADGLVNHKSLVASPHAAAYDDHIDTTEHGTPGPYFSGTHIATNGAVVTDSTISNTALINFNADVQEGLSTEWCLRFYEVNNILNPGDFIDLRLVVDTITPFTGGYPTTPRITFLDHLSHPYIPEAVRRPAVSRILTR